MAMATATTWHQISITGFSSNLPFPPSFLLTCFSIRPNSHLSSFSSLRVKKVHHRLRVSSEEYPVEEIEDSKFVPLNPEDPRYGPPALLLLGFKVEEADKIQLLLKDLDGDFLKVIYCTEDMITRSLWDAVNSTQQSLENIKFTSVQVAKSLPRICFLSGLTGEEMMLFIEAFQETDIEPAIFAALVPNSANKSLQELVEEVMGDHEMMTARQSESQ